MKKTLLLLTLILAGCTTTQPKPQVLVPVECPKVTIPAEPALPIADLKQGDSHDKVAKSYVATVVMQQGYIEQLRHILKAYS